MSVIRRSNPFLLALVVVGLCLGMVGVVGVRQEAGGGSADGLLRVALLAVTVAVFALRRDRLSLGVALIPFTGAAIPISIGTSTQSPIVGAVLLTVFLLGLWVVDALARGDMRIAKSPLNGPLLFMVVVWTMSMLNSEAERDPLIWVPPTWAIIQLGGLGITIVSCAAMWLALNTGRETRWLRLATWSFLGAGVLAGAAFYSGLSERTSIVEFGGLFTMWVVTLAYGQAIFNDELPLWKRAGLFLLAGIWLYKALVLQIWFFSGWGPPLVAILVVTWARSRKAGLLVTLASAALIWMNYDEVYDIVYGGAEAKGDLTRLDIWANAMALTSRYPLLGTGPAGYAVYFQSLFADTGFAMSTHSNYWDVVLQTGILGLVVFVWLFVVLVVVGLRACRQWRTGFLGGYAAAALGGLAGLLLAMALGDWFIPFVYNQTIAGYRYTVHSWVFLGFLASLSIAPVGRRPDSTPGAADRARPLRIRSANGS